MTAKLIVITDGHANLPALAAVLAAVRAEGYDLIVHTGDAIGIGPYPAECLDLLGSTPRLQCIMGNHDAWFVDGLPDPQPAWMSDGEVAHQRWTHGSIDPAWRATLAAWPYRLTHDLEGMPVTFVHYALLPSGRAWAPIVAQPRAEDLDRLFAREASPLIFYGHHHPRSDLQGRARYVNPGALGCAGTAVARYAVAEFHAGQVRLELRELPYDDTALFTAFEERDVPDRKVIYDLFFGGRFSAALQPLPPNRPHRASPIPDP